MMKRTLTDQMFLEEIEKFSHYSNKLESLLIDSTILDELKFNKIIKPEIANGASTEALVKLISYETRKSKGFFFTNNKISEIVADIISTKLKEGCTVIDPACGAGNLLVSCAKYLPKGKNIKETLFIWSKLIKGYDLYREFIKATKLRLILFGLSIHYKDIDIVSGLNYSSFFDGLKTDNSLDNLPYKEADCIIVNPPFGYTQCPINCNWSKGKIQIAALFLESIICNAIENQHVVAILPDVLRSGTRYIKWRYIISTYCESINLIPFGRFDKNTDVDVFILNAIISKKRNMSMQWPKQIKTKYNYNYIVSDFFDVHVGSVVPHRDFLAGLTYNYIHAKNTPAWKTITIIKEKIKCSKSVFKPPFIVVKRTSSPSDKYRCIATIINTKESVAVENHLIVLKPKNNSIESCNKLIGALKSSNTNEWMNDRIRCRHLTVKALEELPCYKI